MTSSTLIMVVANINARIDMYKEADPNDPYYKGAVAALRSLGGMLQAYIDSDIDAMESTTGE